MNGRAHDNTGLRVGPHLGNLLATALRRRRDEPVLVVGDTTLTGGELATWIAKYVAALAELGIITGSPLGLLALNRPEVLMIIGAGQTQGYCRTALHPLGSEDDHAWVLGDAGIETLIIDPYFGERAAALQARLPQLRILTLGPVPEALTGRATDLSAAAAARPETELTVAYLPSDHVASITYTGGTTGRPKGVIGTVGSLATMTQIQLAEWEWPDLPRFLMCTPLSHAGAAFFVPVVMRGGGLVVAPRFEPGAVLQIIEEQRITATMLVPSMIYALLDHPDLATRDTSSLETVYYGASAINPTRLAQAVEHFGPVFAQYYGQSEAPMAITYLAKADHRLDVPGRLASCGRPSAFLLTALLDDADQPVRQGEPGEICVAGPLLAGGYRDLPEETAATFRDGWLRTGDIAREDEEGFWFIVDRVKDMIVTGGFNVFPREVEDVIATHPAVAQVAVIGTPDEKWGEAVTALVVLREGYELTDELVAELTDLVRTRKGGVQAPKQVLAVPAIPLTGLGKPDKVALRQQFWTGDRSIG